MHGKIAFPSQSVQNIREVTGNQAFTGKDGDAVCGVVFFGQGNAVIGEDEVDDGFADHAKLHQAGIGIAVAVFFRQLAEIREHGEGFLQECEIRVHGICPQTDRIDDFFDLF